MSIIQLESSLSESLIDFEGIVNTLLESCSLDKAFNAAKDANIASIGLMDLFYLDGSNGKDSEKEARKYTSLIRSCLGKFSEIMPGLNGNMRHVDLYAEQMRGRIRLINRIYSTKS